MTETITHTLSHKGFPVHVKEYAKGTSDIPLVIIGGAFQNIEQIERMSKALAKHTWVIAFDTPGNGATGVLPHDYSFDFISDCIASALEELRVRKINLVGFSYGSIVAMRFVQHYRSMVSRLVLGGAMHRMPKQLEYDFNLMVFYLKWDKNQEFADCFTNLMSNPELRKTNRLAKLAGEKLHHALLHASQGMREQFKHNTLRILQFGNTDLSKLPDVPTVVFTGEYDIFVPPAANKLIAAAFPRGRYESISGADHMAHVIQFKKTVDLILRGVDAYREQTPAQSLVFPTNDPRYGIVKRPMHGRDLQADKLPISTTPSTTH